MPFYNWMDGHGPEPAVVLVNERRRRHCCWADTNASVACFMSADPSAIDWRDAGYAMSDGNIAKETVQAKIQVLTGPAATLWEANHADA